MKSYDEFSDMKYLFGPNVFKVVKSMTVDEILQMDEYCENGLVHHELKEIAESLMALVSNRAPLT